MARIADPNALDALRRELAQRRASIPQSITICAGTACQACGCLPVAEAMRAAVDKRGLAGQVHLRETGCHGFCEQGPMAIIEPSGVFYCHIAPEDVEEIVEASVVGNATVERLLYTDPASGKAVTKAADIPFYAAQDRVLLGDNATVRPDEIDDYIAVGGYSALAKTLTSMAPEEVIEQVTDSGLRGRGGGGYLTGRKWKQCSAAEGEEHYIICNADEGDPGAYMDRSLLEGNPHSVLEGMLIGAYAIGSGQGYVYVRREYPLAVNHIRRAVEQARARGLLGMGILGTDFSTNVKVVRGGGAFVCGESTALMASLEGRVGEPRAKDVHTVEKGYRDQPTCLNNVETWANVPKIVTNGADWFASKGTAKSTGTKIFTLTGQVLNSGLIEVEMGVPLREILHDIGGGSKDGTRIKAVQTGGPSGGCLPEEQFDLPVDFDVLEEAGSMVGSGGMIALGESSCMVDVARYFLTFLGDESCGSCTPCRVGVSRMLEIVTDICEGRGTPEQLDLLEDLAWTVSVGSLCALGRTAPNPVLSTLRYFRDEYEAHIEEKRCPAKACRALIEYSIDEETCVKCGLCAKSCPHGAVTGSTDEGYSINCDLCTRCGICAEVCRPQAVDKVCGQKRIDGAIATGDAPSRVSGAAQTTCDSGSRASGLGAASLLAPKEEA